MSNSEYRLVSWFTKVDQVEVFDHQTGKHEKMPKPEAIELQKEDGAGRYEVRDLPYYIRRYEGRLMRGTSLLKGTEGRYAYTDEDAEDFYQEDLARLPEIIQKYEEEEERRRISRIKSEEHYRRREEARREEAYRQAEIDSRFSNRVKDTLEIIFELLKNNWILILILIFITHCTLTPTRMRKCSEPSPLFSDGSFPSVCEQDRKETE
jgi:hypothetical protein